jgi:transposase
MTKKRQKKPFSLYKSINHIKLKLANTGKLNRLNKLGEAYSLLMQNFIDYIFENELKNVSSYGNLPKINSQLSERYKRCAWQQAAGIMKSFYANNREKKPNLKTLKIQGNVNVIQIQGSKTKSFSNWLRISTLEKGKPIFIPINIHKSGKKVLGEGQLCGGVTLSRVDGQWYATLAVEIEKQKPIASYRSMVGVDLGIKSLFTASTGHSFGQFSDHLKQQVEKADIKNRRKQKLNACLKKKGKPEVDLSRPKIIAFVRNEIGRAANNLVNTLEIDSLVVLEKLSLKGMNFKSKRMNRILKASKIGFALEKLKEKLDYKQIRYTSVPAAYSSQECSECGYVHQKNRPTQEKFNCGHCDHTENADVNASKVLVKRFGDAELLNVDHFREVKTILMERFYRRFPDASSTSGGLEPGTVPRKVRVGLREIGWQQPTVNQST